MATQYPVGYDDFPLDKVNETIAKDIHPAHHNDLADAINELEHELGLDPSGSFSTVGSRLDDLTADLAAAQGLGFGNTLSGDGIPDPGLGQDGDFYIQTDSDPPVIFGPKDAGAWGDPITIGGGAMLSGLGPPDDGMGSAGDFYVDLDSDPALIYGPKTEIWGPPVTLSAPTGAGGPAGGVLGGIYPNPSFAVDMATQAELDAVEDEIADISGVPVIGGVEPPTDDLGLDGSWWFDTSTGKLYGPKAGGVWDVDTPLLMGGIAIANGALAPTVDIGGEGDIFLRTSTNELYVKNEVDWGDPIALTGPEGPPGADLNNLGIWDSGTTYVIDDLVQHQGTSWYAVLGSTNVNPLTDDGSHWKYFARGGATGPVGSGFFPGLVVPAAGSCPPVPVGAITNSVNTGRFAAMNPVPEDGTLDAMALYIDTAAGNVKFLVYDCGATTGGTYTRLYASAAVPVSVGADWLTLDGIGLTVTAGDRLMCGYVADSSASKCGRLTTAVGSVTPPNTAVTLPSDFAPAGVQTKLSANAASSFYTYAAPAATIVEANMLGSNTIPCVIAQVSA